MYKWDKKKSQGLHLLTNRRLGGSTENGDFVYLVLKLGYHVTAGTLSPTKESTFPDVIFRLTDTCAQLTKVLEKKVEFNK